MSLHDPFHARDTFDTGAGPAGIYRLSRLEDAGLTTRRATAVFDPRAAGIRAAQLRRLRSDRERREEPGRLERRGAGEHRGPVQAGAGRAAGFHRRAVRGRSGGHAERDEAAGRRSEADQSAGARSIW